jgi:hypothetical protein
VIADVIDERKGEPLPSMREFAKAYFEMTCGKGKQAKMQFERFRGSVRKYELLEKARDLLVAWPYLSSSSLVIVERGDDRAA